PDMAAVRAGVDGEAVGAGVEAEARSVLDAREVEVAGVAEERDLVEVHAQRGPGRKHGTKQEGGAGRYAPSERGRRRSGQGVAGKRLLFAKAAEYFARRCARRGRHPRLVAPP